MFTSEERARYEPQFELPGFGIEGQMKLKQSKVLVIGAGGLGCPVLQYLSAAGIGMLGLADGGNVAINNLQRQVLYGIDDIGKNKAEVATLKLKLINNNILYNCYPYHIRDEMAKSILRIYDVILDCTQVYEVSKSIREICCEYGKPWIHATIDTFQGEVQVITDHASAHPDEIPTGNSVKNSSFGFYSGILGSIMAGEAVKLIAGFGNSLAGKKMKINFLDIDIRCE